MRHGKKEKENIENMKVLVVKDQKIYNQTLEKHLSTYCKYKRYT